MVLVEGITFDGPMAVEEAPPPKMWGSSEMSLGEAMQAQQWVLESDGWSVTVESSGETRGVMTPRNSFWKATLTFKRTAEGAGTLVVRLEEK